jgi:hypothetical protein
MSEELKRKLFNYEVNPPDNVWDKIADSLSEEITAGFPEKLHEAEETPPAEMWTHIASHLDDSKEEFAIRLYTLEVQPPLTAWQKISSALADGESLPVIRSKTRPVTFLRYAAAASIVAAVAFATFKMLDQKNKAKPVADRITIPKPSPKVTTPSSNENFSEPEVATTNNLPKERAVTAKPNPQFRRTLLQDGYMTQMVKPTMVSVSSTGTEFQQASLRGEVPGDCPLISDADRYLMFTNPDGYLIRMSRKLAETLGCIYSNGNSREYKQCQEQIKKWRDKIAQSPATSSPDNFMGILDIIKSAQQNKL